LEARDGRRAKARDSTVGGVVRVATDRAGGKGRGGE